MAADAVVAEITAAGGRAVAAAEDVSTMDGGRRIMQAAVDEFGRLDVFRAQGFEVAHLAGLAWDKVMKREEPWDVASIADRLPDELGPTLTPRPVRRRDRCRGRSARDDSESGCGEMTLPVK